MYAKKRTIINELRAAVPDLRAVAHRADAVAAKTAEEGPRHGIERVGIRAADLITAISGLFLVTTGRAIVGWRRRDRMRAI